jgi:V8-like Glu-specific endopeptidase
MSISGALSTITARTATVGLGVIAAASLSIGAAAAAPQGAAATSPKATSSSSTVPLTAEAKAAGKAKFGAAATSDQALAAYWTADRMRGAIPVETTADLAAKADKFVKDQQAMQKAGKKPVTNDGPVRAVDGAASKVFGTGSTAAVEAAYNPNLPYYVPTAYTAGKVFFTKDGLNYVCSGTIVNSEGKDSVWTAGHCVHGGSGGTWHSNWTFVPAYDDDLLNPRPYGTWSAAYLSTRNAWINSSDFSQDFGVATMNTNFGGWHIADYFGGQGLTVNKGKNVYEYAFGYPAEWPFDGGNLMRCQGTTTPEWDYWFTWSQTVKIPCDMTRGSSGGGWLTSYDGNWGYLNGVNSRIDRILYPTIMLSPYFDNDAWDLYNFTRYN